MLVGVEHEFVVAGDSGIVDFGAWIHRLGLPRAHLDPGDLNAFRLRSGAALTCDGSEAEIALPPARWGAAEIESRAAAARAELEELLPRGLVLTGYSTHLSLQVALPGPLAPRYARTFAPALALLVDGRESPGLLIRPRPGRLEVCGEYVDGLRLGAAITLARASVAACVAGVVPTKIAMRLQLDDHRYGWYVDRRAYGTDLYQYGRAAQLRRSDGSTTTAQEHLEACWSLIRTSVPADEAVPVDRLVRGELPLPGERPISEADVTPVELERSVFGRILDRREVRDFDSAPVMATWDMTVFLVVDRRRGRRAFVCVPRDRFEAFLDGELDDRIAARLAQPPVGRKLDRRSQAHEFGVWDELGPRRNLLPVERGPNYRRRRRLVQAHLFTPRDFRSKRGMRGWWRALAFGA